jgi:hypothetical protein
MRASHIPDDINKSLSSSTLTTRINRKEFGITYNPVLDNGGGIVCDGISIRRSNWHDLLARLSNRQHLAG